ncbi:translational machinery protein [Devosia sp.]|uniref:translational machinery protein n=1 Tax=Devosia sp. TaxID=1871048 RepID=UPI003262D5CF
MHTHALVWIDHQQARIFHIGLEEATEQVIHDDAPQHHLHRKSEHADRRDDAAQQTFLGEVAQTLASAKGIMIVGPGQARTEFSNFLRDKFPRLDAKVWAVEAMDHPTDAQIVAHGRRYFRTAERMHN